MKLSERMHVTARNMHESVLGLSANNLAAYANEVAQLEAINFAAETALIHLRGSVCECGFHLEETDAADTLKTALENGDKE